MTVPESLTKLEALLKRHTELLDALGTAEIAFETVSELIAENDVTVGIPIGKRVRILEHGRFDLVVVSSGTVHYKAASGAQFRLSQDRASPMMLGATGDGVADDTSALDAVLASDALEIDLQGRDYHYVGTFNPAKPITNGRVIDDDVTHDYAHLTKVDLATDAQVSAQDDVAKLVTLSQVLDLHPTARVYTAEDLTWPASCATLTLTHGLGAMPKAVELVLVCKTATNGFVVGDEVIMPLTQFAYDSNIWDSGSYTNVYGHTVKMSKSEIILQSGTNTSRFFAAGSVILQANDASFSLTVRAR